MASPSEHIALGKRLRHCPSFQGFGVKPNWDDYPDDARAAIDAADTVFYPSQLYEDLFCSLGKRVFPRNYYRFMGNKIRQTALFQLLEVPHPRTKLYYGKNRVGRILEDFPFPLIAKTPVGSSMGQGVWMIRNADELADYLENHQPAYIQEYLSIDRDLRVVVIAGRVVHAYWRIARSGQFRNNVSQGAAISYSDIPQEALDFAREAADKCCFDEVGFDICRVDGRYYVLEANMVYGLAGFRMRGLNIYDIFRRLDEDGVL